MTDFDRIEKQEAVAKTLSKVLARRGFDMCCVFIRSPKFEGPRWSVGLFDEKMKEKLDKEDEEPCHLICKSFETYEEALSEILKAVNEEEEGRCSK